MPGEKKKEKEKCCYEYGYYLKYYKCSRDALPGDEHCFFHSKNIEWKKDIFNNKFWKEFERQKEKDGPYNFKGFVFPGDISFQLKKFEKDTFFSGTKFSGKVNFIDTQFSGVADFGDAQFSGVAYFERAQFSGEKLPGLFKSLKNWGNKRILKGRYKIDDFRFHLGEKIAREYPVIDRMTKDAWYLDDFKADHTVIYCIWWLLADCGRSFLRWALWSIFLAVFFAVIFTSLGKEAFLITNLKFSFETMLYYSVVTFTTLGFGDITPQTIEASRWVMLEVILGYIMLGGLISILANKLARRS